MLRLKPFGPHDYHNLIRWIDTPEMLVQIAGRQMNFPVTNEQLDISQSDPKRNAFSIISDETGQSIGHCELYMMDNNTIKIDRVIFDPLMKGKGLCTPLIKLLVEYGFERFNQEIVELNVFDWNVAAIRCYERAGLKKNPEKTMEFETSTGKWVAFNMSIDKTTYERNKEVK